MFPKSFTNTEESHKVNIYTRLWIWYERPSKFTSLTLSETESFRNVDGYDGEGLVKLSKYPSTEKFGGDISVCVWPFEIRRVIEGLFLVTFKKVY